MGLSELIVRKEADDETTTVPVRARDPFVILKFDKVEICSKIS